MDGGAGTDGTPFLLALLVVLVLICVCRRRAAGCGRESFANFVSLSESLERPSCAGGSGTHTSFRDGDDPALRALRAQRAELACRGSAVGSEAEGLPRPASCGGYTKGTGSTGDNSPAYRFPFWGAFGEIPEPAVAPLPPRLGEGLGALEYSHYEGLPANWTIPSLMTLETSRRGSAAVPEIYDPSPFGPEVTKGGAPHLDNPEHTFNGGAGKVPYEYSRIADGQPSWYRTLRDPDHEPYVGATSY